jgi:hypothetical protein
VKVNTEFNGRPATYGKYATVRKVQTGAEIFINVEQLQPLDVHQYKALEVLYG